MHNKLIRSLVVWLTAAATLVAGSPYIACRCADGTQKPICLKHLTSTVPCCQGTSCCPEEELPPCCQHQEKAKDTEDETSWRARSCQKTLVQPDAASADRSDTAWKADLQVGITFVEPFVVVTKKGCLEGAAHVLPAAHSAPPDLNVTYCRFLI
ncbi:MAG: hypothetical protein L0Y72_06985 [Gemmataceae bacterium]|nr:hypothetical protein [Gemmataceae bacterium]MCI0738770.1 hypothetical protein [Gemmataceae bacterium]